MEHTTVRYDSYKTNDIKIYLPLMNLYCKV